MSDLNSNPGATKKLGQGWRALIGALLGGAVAYAILFTLEILGVHANYEEGKDWITMAAGAWMGAICGLFGWKTTAVLMNEAGDLVDPYEKVGNQDESKS